MSGHASDLMLDALRLGKAAHGVADHVASCAACQSRRAELDVQAQAFLARFDLPGLAADAAMRAEREPRPSRWRIFAPLITGLALMMIFVFRPVAPVVDDQVRLKGAAPLIEVHLAGQPPVPVRGNVAADAHLAVRVNPGARARFVRLLWESSPGDWGALYPNADEDAWKLEAAAWLAREVVLDGANEAEQLGAVECALPVSHVEAMEILRGLARADCTSLAVPIVKE